MTHNKNENKATRLKMVKIDHKQFAVEILRGNANVNLTQMAKPFGKRPNFWLKTDEAKSYINAMSSFGFTGRSSAGRRKARHPESFNMIYGRNFITADYFHLLKSYYSNRQPFIDFNAKVLEGGESC